jgi:hypothetical protein
MCVYYNPISLHTQTQYFIMEILTWESESLQLEIKRKEILQQRDKKLSLPLNIFKLILLCGLGASIFIAYEEGLEQGFSILTSACLLIGFLVLVGWVFLRNIKREAQYTFQTQTKEIISNLISQQVGASIQMLGHHNAHQQNVLKIFFLAWLNANTGGTVDLAIKGDDNFLFKTEKGWHFLFGDAYVLMGGQNRVEDCVQYAILEYPTDASVNPEKYERFKQENADFFHYLDTDNRQVGVVLEIKNVLKFNLPLDEPVQKSAYEKISKDINESFLMLKKLENLLEA